MLHFCEVLTYSSVLENSTFLKMSTITTVRSLKMKINCCTWWIANNQLIIIYAEPQWSHLLATKTLFLYVVLFCQENSLKLDHVLLISSVDPENTESGLCIHLFTCHINWTLSIVPIVYYLQLLIRPTIIPNWYLSICSTFGKNFLHTVCFLLVQYIYISFWINFIQSQ